MNLGSITFGPKNSFLSKGIDGIVNHRRMPKSLRGLLRTRHDSPDTVSLGPSGEWYASFNDQLFWGNTSPEFHTWICNINSKVKSVCFGPDRTWHVLTDDGHSPYCFLPADIKKWLPVLDGIMEVVFLTKFAMNQGTGDWWIQLSNGSTCWQNYSGDEHLEWCSRKRAVHVTFGTERQGAAVMENGDQLTWNFHDWYDMSPDAVYVQVRDIRYTQNSILSTFRDGTPIRWLSNNLRWGVCSAHNIPPIHVVKSNRGLLITGGYGLSNMRTSPRSQ